MRRLKGQYEDRVEFHILDIDQPPAHDLAVRYGAAGIPAIVLLDADGNVYKLLPGDQSEEQLTAAIEDLLAATSQ